MHWNSLFLMFHHYFVALKIQAISYGDGLDFKRQKKMPIHQKLRISTHAHKSLYQILMIN